MCPPRVALEQAAQGVGLEVRARDPLAPIPSSPRPHGAREARDTAVVTSDEFGEEKRLVWENEADLHQVPMELRALYRQLDSEREEKKAVADEVVKMRDYQFYHETMQARIHAIEERWELSGRPFTDTYRKAVDREIEEAVITTQEEFAAYFKARDERLFALVERSSPSCTCFR